MNFGTIISVVLPAILQLLNDPNFQAFIKAVEGLFNKQVAAGTSPVTAGKQAGSLLLSGAALHLTGNPVADFQAWLGSLQPPVVSSTSAPGKFTS